MKKRCSKCTYEKFGFYFPKKGSVCLKCLAARARVRYHNNKEHRAEKLRKTAECQNTQDVEKRGTIFNKGEE